jgi:hypothetical protein
MKDLTEKIIVALSIFSMLILAVPLIQISKAEQVDPTTKSFVVEFLSDVVELDLTKYNITNEGYGSTYPPEYGGEVKEEILSFDLVSSEGSTHVMCIFLNRFIGGIYVNPPKESTILFKNQPPTNAVDESKNILQRYKTFAENYGFDTSHMLQALTLVNYAGIASSSADLHNFSNITGFVPSVTSDSNMKQEITQTDIRWIYTDKGVDMPIRCMAINFGSNRISFADTWNLFSVGSFSVISEDEAKNIAWDAAQSYDVVLIGENDTLIHVDPEWANRSSVNLNMVSGEIYNSEVNKASPFLVGGNATRDPMALYPLWHVAFAFNQSLGGIDGIQVGVWGDTSEIAYISEYGHLGGPLINTEPESPSEPSVEDPETTPTEQTEPLPEAEPEPESNPDIPVEDSEEQTAPEATQTENSNPSTDIYVIVGLAVAAIATVVAVVVFKKRNK